MVLTRRFLTLAGVFLAVTALLAATLPLTAFGQATPGTIKIMDGPDPQTANEPHQVCEFHVHGAGFTQSVGDTFDLEIRGHGQSVGLGLVHEEQVTIDTNGNFVSGQINQFPNPVIPDGHFRAELVGTNKTKVFKVQCDQPDLVLTKTASTDTPDRGGSFTYTIEVENTGGSAVDNVTVEDTVPDGNGYEVTGVTGPNCTFNDNDVACDVGTVQPGAANKVTITITVAVPSDAACTDTTNSAAVFIGTQQVDFDGATTTPQPCVALSKSAPASTARGGSFDYTIEVENTGDADATGVEVTDEVPDAYEVTGVAGPGCTFNGNDVTCAVGTVQPGPANKVTITITVDVLNDAPCVPVDNNAEATMDVGDVDGSPAEVTTTPTRCPTGGDTTTSPNLALTKTAPGSAELGESFDYTLTLTNTGTATATGVTVTDTVPAPFEVDEAPDGCTLDGNTVTCAGLSVPTGTANAVTITIPVTVPENADCEAVTNTASFTSTNAGSGSDSATTEVTGCVDVLGNGHLEVRTVVVGDPPANASFAYEAECGAFSLGPAGSFSMGAAGGTHGVGIGIPDGTVCTVTQTDDGGADEVTVSVSRRPGGVVGAAAVNAAATILENTTAVVTFTNVFFETQVAGPGTLVVRKEVSGTPATGAEYVFEASCDGFALGQAGRFTISAAGGSHEVGVGIPDGTRCTVAETSNGGADSTTVSVDGGAAASGATATVDIAEDTTTTVGFTNTFTAQAAPGTIRTPTRVDAGGGGTAPDVPPLGAALVAIALAAAVTMGQLGLRLVSRLGGGAARR